MFTHFVANSEISRKYVSRGVHPDYYDITKGGHWNLLQYYKGGGSSRFITILQGGGGVSRDPKFVLRNIWTAPYMWRLASQQYSMPDLNCCLNHPTDPWRLLLLGQYPCVPDNGSIRLVLPKTDKHQMNISWKGVNHQLVPFHFMSSIKWPKIWREFMIMVKVLRKNGCQVQTWWLAKQ